MWRLPVRMLLFTMGAAPVLPGCAATPPARPVRPREEPATAVARVSVTGIIVNGVTARPLMGAVIDLDNRAGLSESGLDGRFRIDDVPVGVHLLRARAVQFRSRLQPVKIVPPDADPDAGPANDFIVLLFGPSGYFSGFPSLGSTPACRTEADCPPAQICLMNNFREGDAPTCTPPVGCGSESDCKIGQQCEPVTLLSGQELRVCQGQPAPEAPP